MVLSSKVCIQLTDKLPNGMYISIYCTVRDVMWIGKERERERAAVLPNRVVNYL